VAGAVTRVEFRGNQWVVNGRAAGTSPLQIGAVRENGRGGEGADGESYQTSSAASARVGR
jgi:hypothetical protein